MNGVFFCVIFGSNMHTCFFFLQAASRHKCSYLVRCFLCIGGKYLARLLECGGMYQ